jgi:hypothetical protein
MIEYLFVNIITTGAFIGAATWLLKRYLGRKIDNVFVKREKTLEAKLRVAEKYEKQLLEISMSAIPELQQVVYRSRNILREITSSKKAFFVNDLVDYWIQLTEYLYRYQIFVSEQTFKKLHSYKNVLQASVLILSKHVNEPSADRIVPSHELTSCSSNSLIADDEIKRVSEQLIKADNLYNEIILELRQTLSKSGLK